ncbi:UDP-N-acetylmuramyl-tripeptide synthetase [bacterium]|nr:UDP-N-acetylmuramyl-tripeptide synthetase [bacterium]
MNFKSLLKKLIPSKLLYFYHYFLARFSVLLYFNPCSKLKVIGVTGTAGKSTVVWLTGNIFELAGIKTGWVSTISFKIGDKQIPNSLKMTMPGRFFLSRALYKMVKSNKEFAIIETSSQGIIQARHLAVNYDVVAFTNLSPEHIEAHKGFENYKRAKGELFAYLSRCPRKMIKGEKIPKVIVVNLDDDFADYFLSFRADKYYGYTLGKIKASKDLLEKRHVKVFKAENICIYEDYIEFEVLGYKFKSYLPGEFNVYNVLASLCLADFAGLSFGVFKECLEKIKSVPGRMECILKEPFSVYIDYAHTPEELEKVYQTLSQDKSKLICVLGSAGGGRDKWKREKLGEIAFNYCQDIILTNEDPYDEDPEKIILDIEKGIKKESLQSLGKNLFKVLDRKKAIEKAISLAKPKDKIVITGKGSELAIMGPNNTQIPWNDKQVCLEILKNKKLDCG